MTKLGSVLKSRDITLPVKVHVVTVMVFPVVMYECESWTVKKAEYQRIYVFELWCCRRVLRDPWTSRRLHQSILKEISPECSLEGLLLKLQYFSYLMQESKTLVKKSYDQPKQHITKQTHYFANNGPSSQSYGFSHSHIWM